MKKLSIFIFLFMLSACVNTETITSGTLIVNNIEKDLSGKTIILNKDCTPKQIKLNIPYCGNSEIKKNEICTTTPDKLQYGYKIFQVLNKKDALVCTINNYGICYGNLEYIKNLGLDYDNLIDNVRIEDNLLLKKEPFSYTSANGVFHTVNGYELITKIELKEIQYNIYNSKTCAKNKYSYSKNNKSPWKED